MTKVRIRQRTDYIIEHNEREFAVQFEPSEYPGPIIEELPDGRLVIGYLSVPFAVLTGLVG